MNTSNITLSNISSKDYCKYDEPESDLEKNAKFIALMFLYVFGIFSNIFIIVIAAKYTVRKNLHHLIINMAVSDALFLVSRLWTYVSFEYGIKSLHPGGVWGDIICNLEFFVGTISYKVSLISLLVISIELFRATRRTLQRSRPYTLKQRVAVLAVSWLIPVIMAKNWYFPGYFDEKIRWCLHTTLEGLSTFYLIEGLMMAFVVIIILTLCSITVKRLSKTRAIQAHLNDEQLRMRRTRTRSVVTMVIVSALLYPSCWFPAILKIVLHSIGILSYGACTDWESLNYITYNFLSGVNSAFSPLIYIIFLSDFQQGTKRVLCWCKVTTNQQAPREEIPLQDIQHYQTNQD